MLQRVHEYAVDKTTREAKLLRVRPIRRWISEEHAPINFQEGKFYDDGGREMPRADVPQYIIASIADHPVTPSVSRAEVSMKICQICAKAGKDVVLPSDMLEDHLIQHIEGKVKVLAEE